MKYLIVVAIALLFVAACTGTPTGRVAGSGKIKIGIATTLSGDLAYMGENVVRSAELTLEYYNLSDRYELTVEDVPCGAGANGLSAFRKLVDVDRVQFIAGALCSGDTLAAAPMLNERHVVLMPSSTGGQNIDEAGEYVFRNGPSDIKAGTEPAERLNREGISRVALITDQSDYTLDIAEHFKSVYAGILTFEEIIPVGERDFRTIISELGESEPDVILVTSQDGVSGAHLVKQLYEQGFGKPVYGNFLVYGPYLGEVAGAGAEGVYIYDPEYAENSDGVRRFFAAYEEKYGAAPAIRFQTTGVRDAILMFAQAENEVGNDGTSIHDWLLANIRDWPGFNGAVTFDAQGNSGTGFVLKQIRGGKLVNIG